MPENRGTNTIDNKLEYQPDSEHEAESMPGDVGVPDDELRKTEEMVDSGNSVAEILPKEDPTGTERARSRERADQVWNNLDNTARQEFKRFQAESERKGMMGNVTHALSRNAAVKAVSSFILAAAAGPGGTAAALSSRMLFGVGVGILGGKAAEAGKRQAALEHELRSIGVIAENGSINTEMLKQQETRGLIGKIVEHMKTAGGLGQHVEFDQLKKQTHERDIETKNQETKAKYSRWLEKGGKFGKKIDDLARNFEKMSWYKKIGVTMGIGIVGVGTGAAVGGGFLTTVGIAGAIQYAWNRLTEKDKGLETYRHSEIVLAMMEELGRRDPNEVGENLDAITQTSEEIEKRQAKYMLAGGAVGAVTVRASRAISDEVRTVAKQYFLDRVPHEAAVIMKEYLHTDTDLLKSAWQKISSIHLIGSAVGAATLHEMPPTGVGSHNHGNDIAHAVSHHGYQTGAEAGYSKADAETYGRAIKVRHDLNNLLSGKYLFKTQLDHIEDLKARGMIRDEDIAISRGGEQVKLKILEKTGEGKVVVDSKGNPVYRYIGYVLKHPAKVGTFAKAEGSNWKEMVAGWLKWPGRHEGQSSIRPESDMPQHTSLSHPADEPALTTAHAQIESPVPTSQDVHSTNQEFAPSPLHHTLPENHLVGYHPEGSHVSPTLSDEPATWQPATVEYPSPTHTENHFQSSNEAYHSTEPAAHASSSGVPEHETPPSLNQPAASTHIGSQPAPAPSTGHFEIEGTNIKLDGTKIPIKMVVEHLESLAKIGVPVDQIEKKAMEAISGFPQSDPLLTTLNGNTVNVGESLIRKLCTGSLSPLRSFNEMCLFVDNFKDPEEFKAIADRYNFLFSEGRFKPLYDFINANPERRLLFTQRFEQFLGQYSKVVEENYRQKFKD